MEPKLTDRTLKRLILLGSGLVLGYCVYSGYRMWKKREFKSIDEGFEDVSKLEDTLEKRILVLGLENAGKTTILSQISSGSLISKNDLKPTEGFNVITMDMNGISVNIWEVGGRDNVRTYWPTFLQDTDILIFVVDSSDFCNISLAIKEVRWLLADERLADIPILLIANKQDMANAIPPYQVANALDLENAQNSKHRIRVVGAETPFNAKERHSSIAEIERILLHMVNEK